MGNKRLMHHEMVERAELDALLSISCSPVLAGEMDIAGVLVGGLSYCVSEGDIECRSASAGVSGEPQ